MELLKLYTALLRRRWLVIQAVVFFTLGAVLLALLLPKNYRATARVLVSSSDATLSILSDLGLSEVAAGLNGSTDDISNKISLATTRPMMDELIWRLQLRDGDGRLFTSEEVLVPGLLGEFEARPNIVVSQQQGTEILAFDATADDPELARLMADTLVRLAVAASQERARSDTHSARIFIDDQLQEVRSEFDRAMGDIASAKADESIIDLESEVKAGIARLSELMLGYEQNAAAIQETRAKLAEARAYQSRETVGSVSPATVAINSRVAAVRERISNLEQERARELTDKTDRHPDIARIDLLLESAQAELTEALTEQHAFDPSVQQLTSQLSGLVRKGAEIDASIQRTTETFSTFPDKLRRMSQLQLAATAAESVYKSLQEQRFQIGVAEALLVSDLVLIEPAKAPDRHYSPKVLVNLVLGVGLGGIFGLVLAFLFEYVDDTIKTPDDLDEIWPILRLGMVPRFKGENERRVIDVLATTHPVSEAYRTVRNGLLYASLDKPLRLIAVSSAVPSEGKSTFTINLAVSFAREGKRVLVVDCDLRRPSQHRHWSQTSNHVGLTDVLARKVEAADALQTTGFEGVTVLTSGPLPTDPARLIESLRLRQLLLDLSRQFDIVLVDTPPALVVNDSMVIGRAVDGVVLVVESGSTSRKLVEDLRERCASGGIEPLGLVLNKIDLFTSGYGHYARAYKGYYSEPGKAEKVKSDGNKAKEGGAA